MPFLFTRIFEALLSLLRPLMSPYSRQILEVYGVNKEEYRSAIMRSMRREIISPRYGGNKTKPK
jgi:hypothetical protein